jgi:hypothetical protein
MKLLKLLSNEELTESQFTNNLAVPLKLKPNSEIALKSLSIEFNDPKLIVDDTNNTFSFRTIGKTGFEHQVVLKEGEYFLNGLIKEIQNKMNNALDIDKGTEPKKSDYAFQWTIKRRLETDSSLVNLQFYFDRKDPINITDSNSETKDMSYVGSNFIKSGADTNTYNSLVSSKILVNNGGFEINMTLTNQGTQDIGFSQWVWGIDNMYSSSNETSLSGIVQNMLIAIGSDDGYYTIKKNGVLVKQALQIQTGDVLKIHKNNGKIMYNITRTGGGALTTYEGDIVNDVIPNLGTDPLTMVLHVGNDTGKIAFTTIKETPNVNVKVNSGVYSIADPTDEEIYLNVNLTAVTSSLVTLKLDNPNVLKLLGFQTTPQPLDRLAGSFIGEKGIEIRLVTDDIIVEIPEISSIDTYVEDFKGTRNAIMIIPAGDLSASIKATTLGSFILSWTETANFCFIDLSNSHALQLPALSIRATSGGKPLSIAGNMSALLLIQSKDK